MRAQEERAGPVNVEKLSEEVRKGVKGQANTVIAGFPRNVSKYEVQERDWRRKRTDSGREGRLSRGEEPRGKAKVSKQKFSVEGAARREKERVGLETAICRIKT